MKDWELMEEEMDRQKNELSAFTTIVGSILMGIAMILAYIGFWNVLAIIALKGGN